MIDFHVEFLVAKDPMTWDNYVLHFPEGSYCHLSGWKTVIEQAYGRPTYYLACRDSEGQVVGLLPTVHIKHFLFGNALVSMPYLDGGGILANHEVAHRKLLRAATQLAVAKGIPQIELRNFHLDNSPNLSLGPVIKPILEKVRMVLPLPGDSAKLFKDFKSNLRSQVRKGPKVGLTFELGGAEKVDDFYRVFAVNMRDLGSPVHSKRFFDLITHILKDYCRVGVVYLGACPVSAGIIFCFRDTVSIVWASSLRSYNRLSPNMLMYWEFLKYAADMGYKYFDFGRSTLGSGTYRFKEQWGPRPQPLGWQYLEIVPRPCRLGARDRFAAIVSLWAKLPVPLATALGPMIRRYISL